MNELLKENDICPICGMIGPKKIHIPERIVYPCGTIRKIGELIQSEKCFERTIKEE